jgi:hypothetical protein
VKRFILHPGYVRSTSDGQEHYISAGQLARLYGVDQEECVIYSEHSKFRNPMDRDPELRNLMPLFPRQDGKYKEHMEQQKIADFHAYVRSRKLFEYHDSGASPKPRAMQKALAERLSMSISWHELHWPDFPAAYERYTKR